MAWKELTLDVGSLTTSILDVSPQHYTLVRKGIDNAIN